MKKIRRGDEIVPAEGKLGCMLVGLGAVSTTLLAGVFALKKRASPAFGSLSQLGKIRLGKRTEPRHVLIREFLPLADPASLEFAAWDIFPENAREAALKAGVLRPEDLETVREELEAIRPLPAVFNREYVRKLDGPNVKKTGSKMEQAEALMRDIEEFRCRSGARRVVVCWAASTESYLPAGEVHASLANFEAGLQGNDPAIAPSQIYAYAALKSGAPFINGAPHLTTDCPALLELAASESVPVSGKDFKTGQTLMKTIIAPGLHTRMLGISGWFSTNILGNRDGEVLDDAGSFKSKEISKLGVLDSILRPDLYPDLYGDIYHKVRINYYPPRGDDKESWDNIDIFGWMGYPMQIKVNFLCRDSILAAPVALDLLLFTDLAARAGMHGIQEWLSFYFKSPQAKPGLVAENNLFAQYSKLLNTMRYLMREELIHHTGLDYYYDLGEE